MSASKKKKHPEHPLPESAQQVKFFNRELSWLEFNRRVLEEALDETNPLLERLKFLAIFSANLDEFFMIRVAGLKEQADENIYGLSAGGLTPAEQLGQIRERLLPMLAQQNECLNRNILPGLQAEGIEICAYETLSKEDKKKLNKYFSENVFPVLTPQAVDASHPFPYVSNLSLNLGLFVEPAKHFRADTLKRLFKQSRFSRVKIPPNIPRPVPLDGKGTRFALLGEIIRDNIKNLFPNMKTERSHLFRVTRDADIELREDESGDLLRKMERELHRQRFGFAVRLEVATTMPQDMVDYLTESIGLTQEDVYQIDGFLNIPDLMPLYALERPDLKDKPISYNIPSALLTQKKTFDILKRRDILLHHPYTSYNTVTDFIGAAAVDENVQAIKICLYRAGKDSPIVKSLVRASEEEKQVTALVELKARFDEENNIEWARRLENEGVHVIYGMSGLKTHSKVTLVIRREGDALRRYVHVATGNYNPTTSKIYTDFGLLTADEEVGADATDLFNFLTGYSYQSSFRKMLVAPVGLRERFIEMIEREISYKQKGKDAYIIAKTNSLTDAAIIEKLYEASQAGVKIDLIVRGICILRPAVEGLSENIRVVSIVGRFLEHSRIFYFLNGGHEEFYIGSADWMRRNLDNRVEVVIPIKDKRICRNLKNALDAYLNDTVNAQLLKSDGSYEKLNPAEGQEPFDAQMFFVGMDFNK